MYLGQAFLDFIVDLVNVGSFFSLQQTFVGDVHWNLKIAQRLLHYTLHFLCQHHQHQRLESKSNAYSEALQYRQDLLTITVPQENTSLSVHVVQKITITRAQKIQKIRCLKFRGGAEKYLNMGAQPQTILYIKPPKLFFNARLNGVSVIATGDTAVRFLAPPVRT